jgi:hypothetical protein
MKTVNTNRKFVKVSDTMKFKDNVFPAWEVYTLFGRVLGVWEKLDLGTFLPEDCYKFVNNPDALRRRWVRLIWVSYPAA